MTIDLTAKNFDIPLYSLKAGELFDIEFSISNQGNDIVDSFEVGFYLSTDNSITEEDTLLGKETITGLAGNSDTELLSTNFRLSPSNPFLSNGNGIYYVGMLIDPDNLITESNEDNNSNTDIDSTKVKVLSITASSFDVVQRFANTGEQVQVVFSVDNLTNLIAEDVKVDFYLSGNDWISQEDYKLGSFTIDSIAGESNSGTRVATFNLPPDSERFWRIKEDGTYFIGMIIPGNSESNQANNFYTGNNAEYVDYGAIDINVSNIVDLTGESFDARVGEFGTVDIDFSVLNIGDGAAGKFTIDFYISDNEYLSSNDFYLGSYEIDSLAADSSSGNLTTSFTLPTTNDQFWFPKGSGAYSIGMVINPSEEVDETFKLSNNSNQGELIDKKTVVIENPEWFDLAGFNFNLIQESIFDSFLPGKTIDVEYGISNRELNTVEEDFSVSFYISTDRNIDITDTLLGSVRIEESEDLIGGTSLVLPGEDAELWTIETERLFVGMIVDSENEIVEINEINNSNQRELIDIDGTGGFLDRIKSSVPDLVMESFKIDSDIVEIEPGTVELEFEIANISQGSAAPFFVEFYISNNEYISTNDFKLGSVEVTESLTGFSSTGLISASFELPDVEERFWNFKQNGAYHIGAVIDPNQEVAEYSQSNNSNFGYGFDKDVVQVVDLTFVDLIGKQFTVVQDDFLLPEDSIDINFEILNQEKRDAGAFTVDFYISNNEYISTNDLKLGSVDIAGLAGESTTDLLEATYQLPDADSEIWDGLDETYYVGMLIDSDNEVQEVTQLNNNNQGKFVDSDTISFIESPEERERERDLFGISFNVVEEASEAEPVISGQNINLEYEIYNQGTEDVDFSAVGFYLFTEEYFNSHEQLSFNDIFEENPDIYFVFGDRTSNFIEIDADRTTGKIELGVKIPSDWDAFDRLGDGYYYMGMLSDQWEEVTEVNELNNSLIGELVDYERVYIDVL